MQNKKNLFFINFFFSVFLVSLKGYSEPSIKWSELRLFYGNSRFSTDPTALNNLTAPDNVAPFNNPTSLGFEADGQIQPWFKVGTKFKGIWNAVSSPNPSSTASLAVQQTEAGLLARFPIVDKEWILLDAALELGLANTKIDVQTVNSGKGTFKKDAGFYQRAGASLGLGSSSVKFYLEVGQEWNNLTSLSYQGTLATSISSIDFSGPYFSLGLIISGIPSWIKPGSVTVGK